MKRNVLVMAGLAATLAAIGSMGVMAQQGTPTNPPAGGKHGEKHPEMVRALKALERAEKDLMAAARDYQGHRAKAADLTNQAIAEVQAGIASDKK